MIKYLLASANTAITVFILPAPLSWGGIPIYALYTCKTEDMVTYLILHRKYVEEQGTSEHEAKCFIADG